MRHATGTAPKPAELTAELLREARGASSSVAAELEARERELAALNGRWPLRWHKLLAPGSAGCERAADAQAAAEARGATPSSEEPPSDADGELLEAASLVQLRESILVWLQATAPRAADTGGAGPGTDPPSLDESGDAPDMARLKQLAQRGVGCVTEILDELQRGQRSAGSKRRAPEPAPAAGGAGGAGGADEPPG